MSVAYKCMTDEQKMKQREYHRAYYHAHRDEILERRRKYKYPQDKEYQRKYYQKNKGKILEKRRERRGLPNRVMVVRCKDCIHWKDHTCYNAIIPVPQYDENWFCADGERRTE